MEGRRSRQMLAVTLWMLVFWTPAWGQTDSSETTPSFFHGSKGWHLESSDGRFSTDAQLRLQLRYSYPFDQDPLTLNDLNGQAQHILQIRRARVKIGGHAFSPKLKYYFEFDAASANLLDFWASYAVGKGFNIMAGQYKGRYNTERVVSSGRQSMVDRSVLTRPFTIDRQTGITLFGNLYGEGALNFSYWAALLTGTGRGGFVPDDDALMWMFRGQWNLFGEVMPFVSSDIGHQQHWRGYLAGGYTTNQSQFTRFSQSGGGQLSGYDDPSLPGQYRVRQFFIESAFKKSGFSWQQEFHWKRITDRVDLSERLLLGNYLQFGSFPVTYFSFFPEGLELAARYAIYVPEYSNLDYRQEEITLTLNWFLSGHNNKLSAEASWLELAYEGVVEPGWRFRIQWDVSF